MATAHLQDDEGLAELAERLDEVELVARPSNVRAVSALLFNRVVDTTSKDDGIGLLGGGNGLGKAGGAGAGGVGSECKVDLVASLLGTLQRADEVRSRAKVVSLQLGGGIGPRSDQGDGLDLLGQREGAVVLEQDNALNSSLIRDVPSISLDNVLPAERAVLVLLVKVSELDEVGIQTGHGALDLAAGDLASNKGLVQVPWVCLTAVNVGTGPQGAGGGRGLVAGVVVRVPDVVDGIAIGRDVAPFGEAPTLSQQGLQEEAVGAAGHAVDGVVRAHEAVRLCVARRSEELGSVVLGEVLLGDDGVEAQTRLVVPVLEIVSGKVLGRGGNLEVLGVDTALETGDVLVRVGRGQHVGIFAGSLLSTAPERAAEAIDVGGVDIKTVAANVVECSSLGRDDVRNLVNQRAVEGCH